MQHFFFEDDMTLWTPSALGAQLVYWFDPNQGVGLSGADVPTWDDVVSALQMAQGTTGNQPDYSATAVNGHPGIAFDGADDHLTRAGAGALPQNADAGEIWGVFDQQSLVADTAQKSLVGYGTNGSTYREIKRTVAAGVNRFTASVGAASVTHAGIDFSGPHIGRLKVPDGGTPISVRMDGIEGPTAAATPATGGTRLRFGAISSSGTPSQFFLGNIGDIIFVAPELSVIDTYRMEGYLAWKYGLASVLPSDHPFKSTAPLSDASSLVAAQSLSLGQAALVGVTAKAQAAQSLLIGQSVPVVVTAGRRRTPPDPRVIRILGGGSAASAKRKLRFPYKDPDESVDYELDWTGRLGADEIILTSTWTLVDAPDAALDIEDDFISDGAQRTRVWIGGGADGQAYALLNVITTDTGAELEQTVYLSIRSR